MNFIQPDTANIFSTPVYACQLDDTVINSEIISNIKNITWSSPEYWGKTLAVSSMFNKNDIENYQFTEFKKALDTHIALYCKYINFEKVPYTVSSWLTKMDSGNYGHIHNHAYVDISGVYYVQTNGDDGSIFFESPNQVMATSYCFNQLSNRWYVPPKIGKLLIFPGWLNHGITTNTTDSTRISLSFNIMFERTLFK